MVSSVVVGQGTPLPGSVAAGSTRTYYIAAEARAQACPKPEPEPSLSLGSWVSLS